MERAGSDSRAFDETVYFLDHFKGLADRGKPAR